MFPMSHKIDFTTLQTQISDGSNSAGQSVTINLPADIANYRYIMAEATYAQYDATYGTILIPVSGLGKTYAITGQNMHSNAYPSDMWAISITTNSTSIKFLHCTLARVSNSVGGNVTGYQDQNIKVGKVWAIF